MNATSKATTSGNGESIANQGSKGSPSSGTGASKSASS